MARRQQQQKESEFRGEGFALQDDERLSNFSFLVPAEPTAHALSGVLLDVSSDEVYMMTSKNLQLFMVHEISSQPSQEKKKGFRYLGFFMLA